MRNALSRLTSRGVNDHSMGSGHPVKIAQVNALGFQRDAKLAVAGGRRFIPRPYVHAQQHLGEPVSQAHALAFAVQPTFQIGQRHTGHHDLPQGHLRQARQQFGISALSE